MRIFKVANEKKLYWKHHTTYNFKHGLSPAKDNGVGAGGHLFVDFNKMVDRIGRTAYWVAPVMLSDDEVAPVGRDMVQSKVTRLAIGDFAPIPYWEKHKAEIEK